MFRQGRLSKKLKCARQNRQCTTLTVSIDTDIWMKARRARHHLEQQLSQVTVAQTLLYKARYNYIIRERNDDDRLAMYCVSNPVP